MGMIFPQKPAGENWSVNYMRRNGVGYMEENTLYPLLYKVITFSCVLGTCVPKNSLFVLLNLTVELRGYYYFDYSVKSNSLVS